MGETTLSGEKYDRLSLLDSYFTKNEARVDAKAGAMATVFHVFTHTEAGLPDAGVGPNGEVLLMWDRDTEYLSLEIDPLCTVFEWFYTADEGREKWIENVPPSEIVSEKVTEKLNTVFRKPDDATPTATQKG